MSDHIKDGHVLLVGTGAMAESYAMVLRGMEVPFTVVGRGEASAITFEKNTGIRPIQGGIEAYVNKHRIPSSIRAIIAVGTENLMSNLILLKDHGVKSMLVEKPAAISIQQLLEEEHRLRDVGENVFVAYNRRFYKSVDEAIRLIQTDGGLTGMHFEFTEWAHKITPLTKFAGVKENWFFANSTHVVDLAFFVGGKPAEWKNYKQAGNLEWHNKSAFAGAGVTDKNILFTYMANWESAGRWSLELLTKERRIYLRPLESIHFQRKGNLDLVNHEFDSSIDKIYKPGLYEMVKAFLLTPGTVDSRLLKFPDHVRLARSVYRPIAE